MLNPFKVFMFAVTLILLFSLLPSGVANQSGINVFASDRVDNGSQFEMTHLFADASIGMICQEPKAPPPNCPRIYEPDPCANFGPSEPANSSSVSGAPPDTRSNGGGGIYFLQNRRTHISNRPEPVMFMGVGYSSASVSPETSGNRKESKPATIGRDNNVDPKTCQSPNRD